MTVETRTPRMARIHTGRQSTVDGRCASRSGRVPSAVSRLLSGKSVAFLFFLVLGQLVFGQGASVVYQKSIQVPVPGATAAYSLDPLNADAAASNGIVSITGKSPGSAKIMVVTPEGVQTLNITVLQPPPMYPAGFVAPEVVSHYGENGSYEFRYSSDPSQWQNNLDLVWRNGARRTELHLDNANLLTPGSASRISFPLASYSYSSPAREVVLLDQRVDNSFLTVDGAMVRGFHYRQGAWQFHSGVTSQTNFSDFLLSADTEEVAGASRTFRVGEHGAVIPNLYFFRMTSADSPGRGGAVGSVMYRYKASDEFQYAVELGASRGIRAFGLNPSAPGTLTFGAAGQLRYDTDVNQLHADFRYAPDSFAGLGINDMRGQTAHVDYSHVFNHRLTANILASRQSYTVIGGASTTLTASGLMRFSLTRHWNVNGGLNASQFHMPASGAGGQQWSTAADGLTVTVPVGVDFATARFGAGVEYQQQTGASTLSSAGREIRGNARVSIRNVQVTGFAGRQTNTPTLVTALPVNSPLGDAIGTQTALATTPDAVAGGLHDNLLLAGLGYVTSASLALAPERLQFGGSVNWMSRGPGHDQFSYNFLANRDTLLTGNTSYMSHAIVYTRQVTATNDISVAFSLVSFTTLGHGAWHPRLQLDARHRFNSLPTFFAPGSHGNISGHVFRDDAATGRYREASPGLAGVEVVLDGQRRTRTTATGLYIFDHVPAGSHQVEAIPHTPAAYYFTTSSSETAEINSRVNFGIAFSAGQVFGFITNDAGAPIGGVAVHLHGQNGDLTIQTGDDGRFDRGSLPPGAYEISLDAASLPAGYWLTGLKKVTVAVNAGAAAQQDFSVKAIRSIAGKVVAYDTRKAHEVPVAGAVVTLRELGCAVLTDKNGVYRFRELPAGNYTVSVVYNGKEHVVAAELSDDPSLVRDANVNVGQK